jgi:hypothetical protein
MPTVSVTNPSDRLVKIFLPGQGTVYSIENRFKETSAVHTFPLLGVVSPGLVAHKIVALRHLYYKIVFAVQRGRMVQARRMMTTERNQSTANTNRACPAAIATRCFPSIRKLTGLALICPPV